MNAPKILCWLGLCGLLAGCASTSFSTAARRELAAALTFHAPFDGSADAAFARGDARIHWGPQWGAPRVVQPGLPPEGAVRLAPGAGRHGDALRFDRRIKELVAFKAAGNVPIRAGSGGTVSFWLRLTPDEDLEPGYCDPIQITSKEWNNAAFFVEFSKDEKPREFRLGVYADFPVWNPANRKWEDIPQAEKPLAPVIRPPFRRDRWTHVVFTWDHFNTGRPDGVAALYLDGQPRAGLTPREQTFTWEPDQAFIMLGLSYTGWMDDLAVFDRALTADEVSRLHRLPGGVADLRTR